MTAGVGSFRTEVAHPARFERVTFAFGERIVASAKRFRTYAILRYDAEL